MNSNINDVVARRRFLAKQAARDAEFRESDHPRREDGKFGSGGGGKKESDLTTVKVGAAPAFVSDLQKRFPVVSERIKYLESLPEEKLHKALDLSKDHTDNVNVQSVRQDIQEALKRKARR